MSSARADANERHVAATLTRDALAAVFEPTAVDALREDSPLAALGFTPADMVCVVDALASTAARHGRVCVLDDQDVADVSSVADLIAVVVTRLNAGTPAGETAR